MKNMDIQTLVTILRQHVKPYWTYSVILFFTETNEEQKKKSETSCHNVQR